MKSFFSKNKIIILSVIAIIIIAVGSFFLFRDQIPSYRDRVAPDMILARSCGMDYLPCCEEGPECSFGQKCCANPENKKDRYCADECGCGGKLEFCCNGTECNDGFICNFGRCEECGVDGHICCAMNQCSDGLVCDNEECKRCGVIGNPCCATEPFCENEKLSEDGRAECIGNYCTKCGTSGDQVCPTEPYCGAGNLINNNFCFKCGTRTRPCCNMDGVDTCAEGLQCMKGFCS